MFKIHIFALKNWPPYDNIPYVFSCGEFVSFLLFLFCLLVPKLHFRSSIWYLTILIACYNNSMSKLQTEYAPCKSDRNEQILHKDSGGRSSEKTNIPPSSLTSQYQFLCISFVHKPTFVFQNLNLHFTDHYRHIGPVPSILVKLSS